MVVDGALVMDGALDLERVYAVLRRLHKRCPVFGRRAVRSDQGWAWQDDPDFSVERQVEIVDLPEPADMGELQAFMARQRSVPLPLDRPRWSASVIPTLNLPDGAAGSAVLVRFHHAIADGVRLTQVMLGMCDSEEKAVAAVVARGLSTPRAMTRRRVSLNPIRAARAMLASAGALATDTVVTSSSSLVAGATGLASVGARAVVHPVQAVGDATQHALVAPDRLGEAGARWVEVGWERGLSVLRHPEHVLDALDALGLHNRGINDAGSVAKIVLTTTPRTVWTGKPTTHKALAWSQPVPLADVKAVGRANECTVNDVLLAAIAGGVRNYLDKHNASVDQVNWVVPINLKPFEDNLPPDLGNYFALVYLPMPLDRENLDERLAHQQIAMGRHQALR